MSHATARKQSRRKGVWEDIKTFEEPGSKLGVIISERIRGKPAYSYQIVHFDAMGANKHLQLPIQGKHKIEDVIFSLVKQAEEFIADKKKSDKA
jgi:hypothetical protein